VFYARFNERFYPRKEEEVLLWEQKIDKRFVTRRHNFHPKWCWLEFHIARTQHALEIGDMMCRN
jgi:hypothetical protein